MAYEEILTTSTGIPITGTSNLSGSIIPKYDYSYSLGSSAKEFGNIYGAYVHLSSTIYLNDVIGNTNLYLEAKDKQNIHIGSTTANNNIKIYGNGSDGISIVSKGGTTITETGYDITIDAGTGDLNLTGLNIYTNDRCLVDEDGVIFADCVGKTLWTGTQTLSTTAVTLTMSDYTSKYKMLFADVKCTNSNTVFQVNLPGVSGATINRSGFMGGQGSDMLKLNCPYVTGQSSDTRKMGFQLSASSSQTYQLIKVYGIR